MCVFLFSFTISFFVFFLLFFFIYHMCSFYFFFFSSRRRHTRCLSDWSSDVCSSDLLDRLGGPPKEVAQAAAAIGREFSHALLNAVMRKRDVELGSALDRLIAAGLQIGRASCRERV